MSAHAFDGKLAGGDHRSIGRANEVVQEVLAHPDRFAALMECLTHADPLLRLRAADAAEKVTRRHPDWLAPYGRLLLGPLARSGEPEVQWHVAQMLPRLALRPDERQRALRILRRYLSSPSSIVKTCAMQALADFARTNAGLLPRLTPLLEALTATGTPAMRARGRKLLPELDRVSQRPSRISSSSRVRGQSSRSRRDRPRSASSRPPV